MLLFLIVKGVVSPLLDKHYVDLTRYKKTFDCLLLN